MSLAEQTQQLNVRVERFDDAPANLVDLAPHPDDLLTWIGEDREIVGWGCALRAQYQGPHAMRDAARDWDDLVGKTVVVGEDSQSLPLALASFGFADSTPGYVVVPAVAVVRNAEGTFIVTAACDQSATNGEESLTEPSPTAVPRGLWTDPGRMTQSMWKEAVRRLVSLLQSGAASKVVLSRDIVVSAALPIDERFLVQRLLNLYPTTWTYAVEGLIGATPEMLAAMDGNLVVSRVLAGTSEPGQEEKLRTSRKERSEHHFAVESVARALAPMAEDIWVPEEPELLELPNVTHLSTRVQADVRGANVLDVIDALHPTAAVCGTPTQLAFDLLKTVEGTQRGRYSGPVGWIDASGSGEFGIALRCGQLSPDRKQLRVFAGGGIMPDSVPEVELAETRSKMKPLLQALGLED